MAGALHRAAIIPAAGMGTRLDKGPKGFLRLGPKTLIEWVADTLRPLVDQIFVAVPEGFQAQASLLLPDCSVICGGASRHSSIAELVSTCDAHTILIQDAARPFASTNLCEKVLIAAESHGAAGAFLDPVVPVGAISNQCVEHFWHRSQVGIFQAPQAFSQELLVNAMRHPQADQFQSTAQLVISCGHSLHAVEGEAENIKITTSLDWEIAEKVIAPRLGLNRS